MILKNFKFSSRLSVYLIGLTCLIISVSANSADFKFSYTNDTDGLLGYFTVNESIFNENIGSPYGGYLQNKFISDLRFSYHGYEYGVDDIAINDQTIFDTFADVSLPTVQGGNGNLASFDGLPFNITLYGNGIMNIGNSVSITGNWTTSYVAAVPEPQAYLMLISGLLLLGLSLRKNHKH